MNNPSINDKCVNSRVDFSAVAVGISINKELRKMVLEC